MSNNYYKTRNHNKCNATEKSVRDYYENKKDDIIELPGIGECKYLQTLGKKNKSDMLFKIEIDTNKKLIIGIQTKQTDARYVENWIHPKKFNYIDNIRNIRNNWLSDNTFLKLCNYLETYRKKQPCAKLNKLSLCISFYDEDFGEVEDFDEKKRYICGETPEFDYFYYNIQTPGTDFNPNDLKLVDDDFIKNKKLYYHIRPIYSTSGKTQLNQPDIFENCDECTKFIKIINDFVITDNFEKNNGNKIKNDKLLEITNYKKKTKSVKDKTIKKLKNIIKCLKKWKNFLEEYQEYF